MRWLDLYIGLMGVAAAFGGVVGLAAGAPPLAVGLVMVVAVALLGVMGWRAAFAARVLLVGDTDPSFDLRGSLEQAGFAVRTCAGPARRACPVLGGEPCPIPGHPVAAIVRVPPAYAGPAAPCGSAFGVWMLEVREVNGGAPAREGAEQAGAQAERRTSAVERPEEVVAALERCLGS